MRCECCDVPEGPFFLYEMVVVNATINFCSKHLAFFKKCAGKVIEFAGVASHG